MKKFGSFLKDGLSKAFFKTKEHKEENEYSDNEIVISMEDDMQPNESSMEMKEKKNGILEAPNEGQKEESEKNEISLIEEEAEEEKEKNKLKEEIGILQNTLEEVLCLLEDKDKKFECLAANYQHLSQKVLLLS